MANKAREMTDYEFYKDLYFKELERKGELNESISIPVGIISGILAGVFYLITNFDYAGDITLSQLFTGLAVVASLSALATVFYLVKSYSNFFKNYKYSGIPYAGELEKYKLTLREHFGADAAAEKKAAEAFDKYFFENVIRHLDNNAYINDKRIRYLALSKSFLFFTLLFVSLSCVPYFISYFQSKEKVTKVELTNDLVSSNQKKLIYLIDSITDAKDARTIHLLDSIVNSQGIKDAEDKPGKRPGPLSPDSNPLPKPPPDRVYQP